jgi:serine/threonine protein kinase
MTQRVIGDYVLKDKLGFGQYGNVYLAEDQKLKNQYAVKIMGVQKFKCTPRLSEFTSNEIDILSKTTSPHIIKFK